MYLWCLVFGFVIVRERNRAARCHCQGKLVLTSGAKAPSSGRGHTDWECCNECACVPQRPQHPVNHCRLVTEQLWVLEDMEQARQTIDGDGMRFVATVLIGVNLEHKGRQGLVSGP